jgi:hypothetical protein
MSMDEKKWVNLESKLRVVMKKVAKEVRHRDKTNQKTDPHKYTYYQKRYEKFRKQAHQIILQLQHMDNERWNDLANEFIELYDSRPQEEPA